MKKLLLALLACTGALAQDFEDAPVLEARIYQRQERSVAIAGANLFETTIDMSRVTVALGGMRITGDFESKGTRSPRATDLKVGNEVPAAVERNRLVLRMPDGTVVRARIVRREKIEAAE